MKYVISLSVCFFLFLRVHGAATELSSFIDHGNPWQATPSFFMNSVNQPGSARSFDWVSADTRNQARFPSYANSPELALWGMKVWEALASFETNLTELKISIYNRGDAEARNERVIRGADAMAALLRQIDGRMVKWAGAKGRDDTDRSLSSAGAAMKRRHYYKGKMHYGRLEWSYSGRTSSDRQLEYATVYFEPLTRDNDMRLLHNRSRQQEFTRPTAKSLVEKVMRTPQGDVYIDGIPMVNQGQRSFCSAATVERILRHYGHDVDQHVIAQLAQSSASAGTDGNALREALKKASSKLGVKMKPLYQMAVTVKDWQELAKDYNRSAKRKGLPEVPDSQWISRQGRMTNFATGRLVDAFNWDVYKEHRLERLKSDYRRFQSDIKRHIDTGVPLTWSVILGRVEEQGLRQTGGRHMRLIIGYNAKAHQLIYSDSWGTRHEFKRMPMEDAWSITTSVDLVAPRFAR
jgi:hypothetical protein